MTARRRRRLLRLLILALVLGAIAVLGRLAWADTAGGAAAFDPAATVAALTSGLPAWAHILAVLASVIAWDVIKWKFTNYPSAAPALDLRAFLASVDTRIAAAASNMPATRGDAVRAAGSLTTVATDAAMAVASPSLETVMKTVADLTASVQKLSAAYESAKASAVGTAVTVIDAQDMPPPAPVAP